MQPGQPKSRSLRAGALLGCLLPGILCAKAFVINPQIYAGKSAIPAESTDLLWTFMALVWTGLFYAVFVFLRMRPRVREVLAGLAFGVLNYFGTTLFAYDSWAFIGFWLSWGEVAVKCLCQGMVMTAAMMLLRYGLTMPTRKPEMLKLRPVLLRIRTFYAAHPLAACLLWFAACYLPYLVIYFPGTIVSDMAWMFEQFEGISQMTTWHSVFTTWVFGYLVRLGRWLGSDRIGCCLYMLLQTAAFLYALARSVCLMRRLGASWRWQAAAMAAFALLPIGPMYCVTLGKDTLHTAMLLLLLVMTVEWSRGLVRYNAGRWLAYAATALLGCLWRNNGVYVVVPSLLLFSLCLAKRRQRLWALGIAACLLAAVGLLNRAVVPALGIVDNTASGIYSVCFQQTARTVRDHGDELTEQERAEIDRVLELDRIGNLYEPWISDPVKYTYRQFGQGVEVEQEALSRYRKTWWDMLKKYPVTYLQAFMAGNRGYYSFIPKYTGITYSQQAGARFVYASYSIAGEGQLDAAQLPQLEGMRNLINGLLERLRTIPVIQMFFSCAPYTWTLVGVALALSRRRLRELALFAPAALSFAVCLVSPVDDYFRYFLPVIAMCAPLACCVRYASLVPEKN